MESEALNHELIGAVYHAATDRDGWPAVLERVKARFTAQVVLMARHDLETGVDRLLFDVGLDPHHAKGAEEFAPLDPWMRQSRAYQPYQVVAGEDVVANPGLLRQELYQDAPRPQHCLHRLCGVICRVANEIWVISLFRHPGASVFSHADRQTLAKLLPHFEQSLALQWEIARERSGRRALLDLVDQLPTAILLVDAEARPRVVNAAAEAILALNDGLVISGSRLKALWHADSERLERLVTDICARSNGQAARAGGHLMVTRPSGLRSFLVTVNPLPRTVVDPMGREQGVAAIVVKDPEVEAQTSPRGRHELAELYELTPAEERVLGLILDGLGLFEAADRLGVTRNTARTHMKHIYAKTGARRQAELVRRLAHLTSTLD